MLNSNSIPYLNSDYNKYIILFLLVVVIILYSSINTYRQKYYCLLETLNKMSLTPLHPK